MSQLADQWDVPIRNGRERKAPAKEQDESPRASVEGAIKAWLRARAYSSSTSTAALHHLCGARATGWRQREGIATIDQLTAAKYLMYLYLRDRGAAPATVRKVKMLIQSLRTFCEETPGLEAALQGDEMGVPMFHLQEALGHNSLEMVRRYYTSSSRAQAEAFYRAFSTRTWQ